MPNEHHDEKGRFAPARSAVAKRMRVALRGQKHEERKTEARLNVAHKRKGPHPKITATDYVRKMSEMRENAPIPINKLWKNPSLAPAEQVAAEQQKIKAYNRKFSKIRKHQKIALERDNAAFRARYGSR